MSPRVSDEDLRDYASRKTYPHTPGEDMAFMALELIEARMVILQARGVADWLDAPDDHWNEERRAMKAQFDDAISAYDAALPEAEPQVPTEHHTHVASAVVVTKADCQTLPPDRLAEHIRFRAEQAIIAIEDKLKALGWTYDAATAGRMEAE